MKKVQFSKHRHTKIESFGVFLYKTQTTTGDFQQQEDETKMSNKLQQETDYKVDLYEKLILKIKHFLQLNMKEFQARNEKQYFQN